jgi:hypothetical protein
MVFREGSCCQDVADRPPRRAPMSKFRTLSATEQLQTWRDGRGREVPSPAPAEDAPVKTTKVVLAAAHHDHDPAHCGRRHCNISALCQRCHLLHDRPEHRRRIRLALRRLRAICSRGLTRPHESGPTISARPTCAARPALLRRSPAGQRCRCEPIPVYRRRGVIHLAAHRDSFLEGPPATG